MEGKDKKNYKPHMMYCKDGSSKKAKTYKEHLALKKKGCGHSPMKMDPNEKQPPKDRNMGKAKQDRNLPEKRKRGTRDKNGNIVGGIRGNVNGNKNPKLPTKRNTNNLNGKKN
tara:strand:- start:298 stop:636 length:339 start_codon:yes stop_codon:yes gene_type:complete